MTTLSTSRGRDARRGRERRGRLVVVKSRLRDFSDRCGAGPIAVAVRTLDRRDFLLMMGLTTAVVALPEMPALPAGAATRDLTGWTTVVGDGVYNGPGQDPVTAADIACENLGGYSRLRANIRRRGIMAHAIAYRKMTGNDLTRGTHRAGYSFRLPAAPTGQTVEGGLFVWDGRIDHGVAFQWVINPSAPEFGQLRSWTGTSWTRVGHLRPDTTWHTMTCTLNPARRAATLTVDGRELAAPYSLTPKSGWDRTPAARLQAEVISRYPGSNATAPEHEAHFRDSRWTHS